MNLRVRRLLARPGAWLETAPGGYALRARPDRRARVLAILSEADFQAAASAPGLRVRPAGGWTPRPAERTPAAPPPGRPGVVEGERALIASDGALTQRRANRTCSPVTWLAARTDAEGRPFLGRAEVAAAERLGLDAEAALKGPSLTMRWDALPRAKSGSAAQSEPDDRALAAAKRVEAALRACGSARSMIEQICIRASALQAAEHDLGLRRREGKALLVEGLRRLARHYRIG